MPQENPPLVHTLDNGFRVVLDSVDHTRVASAALYLDTGSRHELAGQVGMTHFCEHLLFKGTQRAGWQQLGREMNSLGGHTNAWTSTDHVKLYCAVIDKDLPQAIRLLSEMFLQSTFPEKEVDRERDVILEEIAASEDNPEDLCYDRFTQALWLPHPAGRPILGDEDDIASYTRKQLLDFWQARLAPSRLLLSVAGKFDRDEVIRLAEEIFGGLTIEAPDLPGTGPIPGKHERSYINRDLEQINFCLGMTGPHRHHPQRSAWIVYDTILGGGMGSRLFDEVRERRGLAYSIGSSISAVAGGGFLIISGATRPEHASTALSVCREQLELMASDGPTEEELVTAKAQLERSHLLGIDSLGLRCSINADITLYGVDFQTTEEVLQRLYKVSPDDVRHLARQVVEYGPPAMCLVGPLAEAGNMLE
ncbi:MAG: insulinase family protein [Candidatus Sumerlaeia bacterium]|nr:insulinase family protein [Candidatus Sumerlaeia bacterium]